MKKLLVAAALAVTTLIAAPASAATAITFASFQQAAPNTPTFNYTNTGTGTSTFSGSGTTDFYFVAGAPLPSGFSLLSYTLSGTSSAAATTTAGVIDQGIDSGTLTFYSGATTYLKISFTNALFHGAGGSFMLWGSDLGAADVVYTSDLYNFAASPSFDNFGLNLLTTAPVVTVGAGGQLESFHANVTGSASLTAVPEPAAWGLMLVGFGGIGAALRSRRRTNAAFA